MKRRGIKPEWEVFSPSHIVQDAALDDEPFYVNIVLGTVGVACDFRGLRRQIRALLLERRASGRSDGDDDLVHAHLVSPFGILDFFVTRECRGAGLQKNFSFEELG
jgi:hypothetical protein